MAVRNVSKTFTLEQQRQEINLLGADLGDISTLNTPLPNTLARAINYLDETVSSYEGTVWYVSTEGVDSIDSDPESTGYRKNPGRTRNVAFKTVKYALSQASFGDIIHIGPGEFQEQFPLTIPAGVTVKGTTIRSTKIVPTLATNTKDCFLLNGDTGVEDLTIADMFFDPLLNTGWAFRFAQDSVTLERSPYLQRLTILNKGSVTSTSDPYGFDANDAGCGILVDGAVVQYNTLQPAILCNEVTLICANATAIKMTNGARVEWINCFSYFAEYGILAESGNLGLAGTGKTRLRLSGVTGTISAGNIVKYYNASGSLVASGVVESTATGNYVILTGKGTGIFADPADRTAKVATLVGSPALSTGQFKFGTASLFFPGTTDYLTYASDPDFDFQNGDFTVDFWVRRTASATQVLYDQRTLVGDTQPVIYIQGGFLRYFTAGSDRIVGATTMATNTWYHVALSRKSGTTRLFLDGNLQGSPYTDANVYAQSTIRIGGSFNGTSGLTGYIDEFRLSNGIGRYDTTFTPASFAYANDDFNTLLLHLDGTNNSTIIVDDSLVVQDIRIRNAGDTATVATAARIILADYQQFGAEMRSISSAVEFGTYGVKADGTGCKLRLISFNLNFVGSGKDFSQDESNAVTANEIIEVNGGDISYVTIDQRGNVKIGDVFEVDQRQGTLNFGSQAFSVSSLSNLTVTDNVNSVVITPTNITVGNLDFTGNTIETTTGDITIAPAGSSITTIDSDLYVTGTYNVTGNISSNADVTFGTTLDNSTVTVVGQFNADNLRIDGNTLSSTNTNGNITLSANGTGVIETVNDVNLGTSGDNSTLTVVGQFNADNFRIDGNTLSSTNTNGDITIDPNGTGDLILTGGPSQDFVINDGTTPTPVTKFTVNTTTGDITTQGDLTVNGGDITLSAVATNIAIIDNSATSFTIKEGANSYVTLNTTNGTESITLHKNTNIGGNLIVDGDITFRAGSGGTGSITLGDTATDSIAFNAQVSSNVLPLTNNTYDFGNTSFRWKDIWTQSNLYAANLRINTNTVSSTNTNGNIVFDPNGTGSVVITGGASQNFDINDGTTTKFSVASTSGDIVTEGDLTIKGGDITVTNSATNVSIIDNNASAFTFKEGANSYVTLNTTNGSESITLHKNTTVNGNLTVDGDITFRAGSGSAGTITLGDINTDNIVFNADINSSFIPDTNNSYDLGSTGQRWRTVYAGTSGYFANLLLDTNVISSTNANGSVTVDPNGTGDFIFKGGTSQDFIINDGAGTPATKFSVASTTGDVVTEGDLTVKGGDITVSAAATNVAIIDNNATAFTIKEGTNSYVTLNTTDAAETITLHKNTTFGGNATFNLDLSVLGNSTLGNDVNTDILTVNARLNTNLEPSTTNTRDLGSSSLKWANLYVATTADINNIRINTNTISSTNTNGNIVLDPNGTGDLVLTGGASQDFIINDGTTTKFSVVSTSGDVTTEGDLTVRGGDITVSNTATNIAIIDNSASALTIKEGANSYITLATTDATELITLHKNVSASGTLTVTGNTTLNGSVILGDTTADTLAVNAQITTSVNPNSSAAYDLGTSSLKWRDLQLSQKAYIGNIGLTANLITTENANGDLTIDTNGTGDLIFKGGTSQDFLINDGAATPVTKFSVATTSGDVVTEGDLTVKGGDITVSAVATNVSIIDNNASAFTIKEGTNSYVTLSTSNGSESITLHKDTTVSGSLTVDGNITFRAGSGSAGSITFGDLNTDNIVFNADINSTIIPNTTATYDIGSSTQLWRDIYLSRKAYVGNLGLTVNTLSSENTNGNILLDPNGTGYVQVVGSNAMILPVGLTSEQPTGVTGMIRFNTTGSYFEGYNGTAWGSLGGVRSVDNQTFIRAEQTPNEANNTLEFYTGGVERLRIGRTAIDDLGSPLSMELSSTIPVFRINATTQSTNTTTGALTVAGGVGIVKDLYVGGNITVVGTTLFQGTSTTTGTTNFGILFQTTLATSLNAVVESSGTTGSFFLVTSDPDVSLLANGYRVTGASSIISATSAISSIVGGYILTVTSSGADPARTQGVYSVTNLSGSSLGTGAEFTITIDETGTASVIVINNGGASFVVNETITIPSSSIGTTGSNLTLTVATVGSKINTTEALLADATNSSLQFYSPSILVVSDPSNIANGQDVESNSSSNIPVGVTVTNVNGSNVTLSSNTIFINNEELTFANISDVTIFGRLTSDYLRFDSSSITGIKANTNITITANGTGKIVTTNDVDFGSSTDFSTLTVLGQLNADNIRIDDNTISVTNTNGGIVLQTNGTGIIESLNDVSFGASGDTSTVTIVGQLNADNIRIDGNVISSTNTNGNITLTPNGTGVVETVNDVNFGTVGDESILTVVGQFNADTFTLDGSTLSTTGNMTIQGGASSTITVESLTQINKNTTFGNSVTPTNVTVTITGDLQTDNININGNTITNTDLDGDLTILANGDGGVKVEEFRIVSNEITSTNTVIIIDPGVVGDDSGSVIIKGELQVNGAVNIGTAEFTSVNIGNILISGNNVTSTNTNGNITLSANGSGVIETVNDVNFGNGGDLSKLTVVGEMDVDNINFNGNTIVSKNSLGVNIEDLRIIGNSLQSVNTNANIQITPNGTGKTTTTKDFDVTATLTVSGQFNADNLRIDGNTISSTNTNGNITLVANGTGVIETLNNVNLGNPGDLSTLTVTGQLNADNVRIDGSTISSIDAGGVLIETLKVTGNVLSSTVSNSNIVITPDGTGKTTTSKNVDVNATLTVVGQFNADNLRIDGNVISSTDINGNITLTPNGTGKVETVNDVNFGTSGDLSTLTVIGQFNADNVRIDGSTISSIDAGGVLIETLKVTGNVLSSTVSNGNIVLTPDGTGKTTTSKNVDINATLTVTGQFNADNLRIDGNVISSTNTNGNITLTPNGTGVVETVNDVNIGSGGDSSILTVVGQFNADNIRIDDSTISSIDAAGVIIETLKITGNVLSSNNSNANIVLTPNGSGKTTSAKDVDISATLTVVGQLNADNIRIDGNVISSTNTNGNITLTPNGTGVVETVNDVNFGSAGDQSSFTVVGQATVDNVNINGNTITNTDTNGDLTLVGNGTGGVNVESIRIVDNQITSSNTLIIIDPGVVGNNTGDVQIKGNLIVDGVTVTVNSTTVSVDDKNLELGSVASPSDATADGGGITLKATQDKTINWVSSSNYWTSNVGFEIQGDLKVDGGSLFHDSTNNKLTVNNLEFTTNAIKSNSNDLNFNVNTNAVDFVFNGSITGNNAIVGRTSDYTQTLGIDIATGDLNTIGDVKPNNVIVTNGLQLTGNQIIQDTSYTDRSFGVISKLSTSDSDVASISNGTYTNISLSGGSGAVVNVIVLNSKILPENITIVNGGYGYNLGDQPTGTFGGYTVTFDVIDITGSGINIKPSTNGVVRIDATTGFRVPVGNEAQRPSTNVSSGLIRFNTARSLFEGYDGSQWGSVGGVRDVDGNTYLLAEASPGANDNTFYFYNSGTNSVKLTLSKLELETVRTISSKFSATLKYDLVFSESANKTKLELQGNYLEFTSPTTDDYILTIKNSSGTNPEILQVSTSDISLNNDILNIDYSSDPIVYTKQDTLTLDINGIDFIRFKNQGSGTAAIEIDYDNNGSFETFVDNTGKFVNLDDFTIKGTTGVTFTTDVIIATCDTTVYRSGKVLLQTSSELGEYEITEITFVVDDAGNAYFSESSDVFTSEKLVEYSLGIVNDVLNITVGKVPGYSNGSSVEFVTKFTSTLIKI
jgi:hypothetical protein